MTTLKRTASQTPEDVESAIKNWTCGRLRCSRSLLVFLSQVLLIYVVVGFAIYNLSVGTKEANEKLWIAILSSCIGYLLPNPTLRSRDHFGQT